MSAGKTRCRAEAGTVRVVLRSGAVSVAGSRTFFLCQRTKDAKVFWRGGVWVTLARPVQEVRSSNPEPVMSWHCRLKKIVSLQAQKKKQSKKGMDSAMLHAPYDLPGLIALLLMALRGAVGRLRLRY